MHVAEECGEEANEGPALKAVTLARALNSAFLQFPSQTLDTWTQATRDVVCFTAIEETGSTVS